MPLVSEARLNLAQLIPHGYLVTRAWLLERNVSHHALDNLIKSGQVVALVPGVYQRPEADLTWQAVVASLHRMGSRLTVGGVTALEQQGLAHYLPLSGGGHVHLYGHEPMPTWINRLGLPQTFVHHGLARLMSPEVESAEFTVELPMDGGRSVLASSLERAILEALDGVPDALSFEHAEELMQGLANLSPRRLDALLRATSSVKVKRLFFWLAERQRYAWFAKLAPQSYDLGHGKRVLARGGKLDKTYLITVPEQMHG